MTEWRMIGEIIGQWESREQVNPQIATDSQILPELLESEHLKEGAR